MDDQPTAAISNEEPVYDLQEDGDSNSKKASPQTIPEGTPVLSRETSGGTGTASSAAAPRSRQTGGSPVDVTRAIIEAFRGQVVHRRPSLRYRLAVVFAATGLCVLVVAYIAASAGLACGLFLYGSYLLSAIRHLPESGSFYDLLFHAAVLIGGLAVLYALIAPLFRWRQHEVRGMCLPAGAHPVLHSFVQAICRLISAPSPWKSSWSPR